MRHTDRTRPRVAALVLATLLLIPAGAAAQMPTDPAEAMRFFEGKDAEDWADGPVDYLFRRDEKEIWRELDDDDARRRFIAWFWDRRDEELRDRANPFKEGFYTRVAAANKRFTGFPRGWRSDRGRTWIILGQPGSMRASGGPSIETWAYFTYGGILKSSSNMGEMTVYFAQVELGQWEIYGGIGPGAWPPHILQAFDIVNDAVIANPTLEWGG